ncbi:MAG TPA: hemerythrin domain-containing protein [Pyrinomonadaceae bacterium]|nr:hemerythrin domain-containing protein [Pyrinomonadaceae bacterium]
MDAFELLKNDHKKVSRLFEEIESASGRSKTQLFTQLKSELDLHAYVEEKIFYPALENKEESRDITLEAYEEHKVVKDLLAQLASDSPGDEWDAKLKVLKENVEHHVEEEEGELFDKAEDVLSDEQVERLGAEMEAEKARQGGAAAPRESSTDQRPAPAKSRKAAKKAESPGVLKRLANLVGLGDSSSTGARKSGGRSKTAAASKKSAAPKKAPASKKSAGTKKAAASKKSSGAKKSGGSVKKSGKKTTKKTAAKSSKRSGANKTSKRQSAGGKSTKKSATTRGKARKK